ncbi:hypothetical protein CSHISOI_11721, partial [Colletotrichum shisoi]
MAELIPSETSVSEEDELDPGEESEPEFKDDLEITIDETNRERWPDIVLQARRHMRKSSSSSEESDEDKKNNNNNINNNNIKAHPSTPAEPARPRFHLFTRLPKELRDHILLTAVDPVTVEGDVKIDLEWRRGPQAHFRQPLIRSFAAIPLYAVRPRDEGPRDGLVRRAGPADLPPSAPHGTPSSWEAGPVVSAARRVCPSREWDDAAVALRAVRGVSSSAGATPCSTMEAKVRGAIAFGLVRDCFAE